MKNLSFLILLLGVVACSAPRSSTIKTTESTESAGATTEATAELRTLMTGYFTSADQASQDSSYYDISLRMYPIWTDLPGDYLYVEQAVSSMPDQPYRQRVYELRHLGDDRYASAVYSLENEAEAVNKWMDPEWFDQFGPEILQIREGCTVYLTRTGPDQYLGATEANNCKSTLRGATYATSQVVIMPDEIGSWDQGWNDADEQVWGATEGGYVFRRVRE